MTISKSLRNLTLLGVCAFSAASQAQNPTPPSIENGGLVCRIPSEAEIVKMAGEFIKLQESATGTLLNWQTEAAGRLHNFGCPKSKVELSDALKILLASPTPVPVHLRVKLDGQEKEINLRKPKLRFSHYYADNAPSNPVIQSELKALGIDPLKVRWIRATVLTTPDQIQASANVIKKKVKDGEEVQETSNGHSAN